MIIENLNDLITKNIKYDILYIDPPWKYKDKNKNGKRGVEFKYSTMDLNDIKALPINEISTSRCALLMWVTFPLLPSCLEVLDNWNFCYKTIGFNWIKMNKIKTNTLFWGLGHYTRSNSEICILANKKRCKLPKPINSGIHSVVMSPIREHSRKPDEVPLRIVELFGDLPRIELFAREPRKGWDTWGNEINKFSN